MDDFSVRDERDFHNLTRRPRRMCLLDEPSGYASALAKNNLVHQMRYSVEKLEEELVTQGTPHVLQLSLVGDNANTPTSWTLHADGETVAHGSGEFARECFLRDAAAFLDVCREAILAADLTEWDPREYRLLSAARRIAAV